MSDRFIHWVKYFWNCREALIWLMAIALMATINPQGEHHTFCPFNHLGITFCPGCGLGRSVALLFRGAFIDSFRMHPMGAIAVILLGYRSVSIFIKNYKSNQTSKTLNYG